MSTTAPKPPPKRRFDLEARPVPGTTDAPGNAVRLTINRRGIIEVRFDLDAPPDDLTPSMRALVKLTPAEAAKIGADLLSLAEKAIRGPDA